MTDAHKFIIESCFLVGTTICASVTGFLHKQKNGSSREGGFIQNMNILVTLDENYLPYLNTMLFSLLYSNPEENFTVYLLHSSIQEETLTRTKQILGNAGELVPVQAKDIGLENAPTTSRYPLEIYYRIFAAKYLPEQVDRVLYLENFDEVFDFIERRKSFLMLPDQDIISSLYGTKILALDPFRYNMTEGLYKLHALFEKSLTLEWIRNNSVVIHYCGRNKPWKSNYFGDLDVFYREMFSRMEQLLYF